MTFSAIRVPYLFRIGAGLALFFTTAINPALAQNGDMAADLQAARQALQRADQADADQYAPDVMRQARQYLEQAQAAASEQRRGRQAEAVALIQRANAAAELAWAKSEEAITEARLVELRAELERLQRQMNAQGQ